MDVDELLHENRVKRPMKDFVQLPTIDMAYDSELPVIVSIVCNCFNHEQHIKKCIDGFLKQRVNFNVEILIHDDASTDNSTFIIKEYEKRYPNIIKPIYQKENQYSKGEKISSSFQYPRAKGKYLAFCEGDDYWFDPYKLFIQVDFLERNPDYIGCVHDTAIFDCRNGFFERKYGDYGKDLDIPVEDAIVWGPTHKAHLSSWLVNREFFMRDKPKYVTSYKGVGDQPLLIFLSSHGKIRFLDLTMSTYNMYSCATSWRVNNFKNKNSQIELIKNRIVFYTVLYEEIEIRYRKLVSDLILRDNFSIALLNNDFKKIYSKQYRNQYKSLGVKNKAKVFIKMLVPFLRGKN